MFVSVGMLFGAMIIDIIIGFRNIVFFGIVIGIFISIVVGIFIMVDFGIIFGIFVDMRARMIVDH